MKKSAGHRNPRFDTNSSVSWPIAELGTACRVITDGTHLPPPFTESGVPFLFVRNIVAGVIDFEVEKHISEETYATLTRRHRAERGDVLFSAVGSFGVAVVVETDRALAFQRHIAHIKPDPDRLDSRFLACFLNSPIGRAQSDAVAMGGAQRTVTLKDLRRFRVPVPPLDTQVRIATELTTAMAAVDAARRAARERLAAAEALPAAYLREVFEAEEAGEWETTPFGELINSFDGVRIPVRSGDRRPGPYPYYEASGVIDSVDQFLFDGEYLLVAEDGANLVARSTPIAFVAQGKFWVNNHAHVVQPKDAELIDYFVHYLGWLDISKYVTGSAQPGSPSRYSRNVTAKRDRNGTGRHVVGETRCRREVDRADTRRTGGHRGAAGGAAATGVWRANSE